MPVEMSPVSSSNISEVGHDADANELHVKFTSGATHVYSGVTPDMHQSMLDAPSIGSHFARVIRTNQPSRKL